MTSLRLSNPPIQEAIINISFSDPISPNVIEDFCNDDFIKANYPERRSLINLTVIKLPGKDESSVTTKHEHEGFILDHKGTSEKAIQIKLGSLSLHNTKKYLGWEDFFQEFQKILSVFNGITNMKSIQQVGLRYVNEIIIDLPLLNGFTEYLTLVPPLPVVVGNGLSNFFMQLHVPDNSNGLLAIITQNLDQADEKRLKIILDINVVNSLVSNSDEILETLEGMRIRKNSIFQGCLTPKTISMYE